MVVIDILFLPRKIHSPWLWENKSQIWQPSFCLAILKFRKNEELPLEISTWNFLSFWSLRLLFTMLSGLKKYIGKKRRNKGGGKGKGKKKGAGKRRGKSRKMKWERESPGYLETRWEREAWVDVFNSLFLHSSLNSTGIFVFGVLDMIPLVSDVSMSLQNSLF